MSGKRAKPSRWRFVRVAPVAIVAVVVWVAVGFFLLLPDSGGDQAHDWGIGPVPSEGDAESTADPDPSADSSATTGASRAPRSTPTPRPTTSPVANSVSPQPSPTSRGVTRSPAPDRNTSPPDRADDGLTQTSPTQQPTEATTQAEPAAGPGKNNPGKMKGHRDGHGPNDDRR